MKTLFIIILSLLIAADTYAQLYITSGYARLDNKYDCLTIGGSIDNIIVSFNMNFVPVNGDNISKNDLDQDYISKLNNQRVLGLNLGYSFKMPIDCLQFNGIASINALLDTYTDEYNHAYKYNKLIPDLLIGLTYSYRIFSISFNRGVRTDLNIMLGIRLIK